MMTSRKRRVLGMHAVVALLGLGVIHSSSASAASGSGLPSTTAASRQDDRERKQEARELRSLIERYDRLGFGAGRRELGPLRHHEDRTVRALAFAFFLRFDESYSKSLATAIARGGLTDSSDWDLLHDLLRSANLAPVPVAQVVGDRLRDVSEVRVIRSMMDVVAGFESRSASRSLLRFLQHPDDSIRHEAFEILDRFGALQHSELAALLRSPDHRLVIRAADALRCRGDRGGMSAVVERTRGGEEEQRVEAIRILAAFRCPEVVEPLLQSLGDPALAARESARDGLTVVFSTLFPYRRFDLGTCGYRVEVDGLAREAAIGGVRRWWERHRSDEW